MQHLPRPTTYNGIQMRSRLEALYAADLDQLGLPWQYEPECFASPAGQYLPDFAIYDNGKPVNWIEVKPPTADFGAALRSMHIIHATWPNAILIVTTTEGEWPNLKFVTATMCNPADPRVGCSVCDATTKETS